MVHRWEEPFLAGEGGSGAIFFTGCSLRCVFCQNHPISAEGRGALLTEERLADRMLDLAARGVENIDLVSPSHFAPEIARAVRMARSRGLRLPVVWNSNAYEKVETLESLQETVDIFLPDLKFHDPAVSRDLCGASGYFETASRAILAMLRLSGPAVFDGDRMRRGTAIRHLVLPGLLPETFAILDWIVGNLPPDTPLSLMRQYTPMHRAPAGIPGYPSLSRRLTTFEYRKAVDRAESLGLTRVWTQEKGSASEDYTPDFLVPEES
jgi:putative pyruvate formate lyase activating enzyme